MTKLLVLALIASICRGFEVVKQEDVEDQVVYVGDGKSLELKCQTSKPFYKCQWVRLVFAV
jgi:diphthamide synthase subunit DPH2